VTTAAGRNLKMTVPMYQSGRISAGESLHLQVDGGGVVYDQDDGLLPDDPRPALLAPTSGRNEL
jgi:hypothetical protein